MPQTDYSTVHLPLILLSTSISFLSPNPTWTRFDIMFSFELWIANLITSCFPKIGVNKLLTRAGAEFAQSRLAVFTLLFG